MLKRFGALTVGALALLAGCTPVASIHPLVNDKEAASVDEVYLGLWRDCKQSDSEDIWRVERSGNTVYRYQNVKSADDTGEIRLIELDNRWFADILPNGGVVPGHLLALVRLDGDRLYLSFLKEDEAKKVLPYESVVSGNSKQVILTASTAQLRQYLQKAPPAAFEEEAPLCRIR